MTYDVFGMCNPLYDIQVEVTDEVLVHLGFQKGGMFLIDEIQQQTMISAVYQHIVNAESGGSGANTMIGIAQLGGTACYTGKLGRDEHGTLYTESLRNKQVTVCTSAGDGTTGICVVLITPDAERTMCTFLGVCRDLGPEDVSLPHLRDSRYLYVTGYLWDTDTQKEAVLRAMREARAAGVKVALSLSDPFCVERHKADFLQISREHVDLLIGNHEEAQALTGTSSPHEAIREIAGYCDLAAVTLGGKGSLLLSGDNLVEVPAFHVDMVDTTGAGDMYAAGLLYGLTHDISLEKSGRLAAYAASEVVSVLGPRLKSIDSGAVARLIS